MAWTTPRTWTTGETVTAAIMNTHVRDNLNETASASAAAAGDIVYADAANSMGSVETHPGAAGYLLTSATSSAIQWSQVQQDENYSGGSTTDTVVSATYVSVPGATAEELPSIQTTTGTIALVIIEAQLENDTAGETTYISYRVTNATTIAASDANSAFYESSNANDKSTAVFVHLQTGLTTGTNKFWVMGRQTGGASTGTITRPRILVIPLS